MKKMLFHYYYILFWLWHCDNVTMKCWCRVSRCCFKTVTFPQQKPINLAPRYHVASNLHSSRRSDSIEIITETDWWSCNSGKRAGETERDRAALSQSRAGSNMFVLTLAGTGCYQHDQHRNNTQIWYTVHCPSPNSTYNVMCISYILSLQHLELLK